MDILEILENINDITITSTLVVSDKNKSVEILREDSKCNTLLPIEKKMDPYKL